MIFCWLHFSENVGWTSAIVMSQRALIHHRHLSQTSGHTSSQVLFPSYEAESIRFRRRTVDTGLNKKDFLFLTGEAVTQKYIVSEFEKKSKDE